MLPAVEVAVVEVSNQDLLHVTSENARENIHLVRKPAYKTRLSGAAQCTSMGERGLDAGE